MHRTFLESFPIRKNIWAQYLLIQFNSLQHIWDAHGANFFHYRVYSRSVYTRRTSTSFVCDRTAQLQISRSHGSIPIRFARSRSSLRCSRTRHRGAEHVACSFFCLWIDSRSIPVCVKEERKEKRERKTVTICEGRVIFRCASLMSTKTNGRPTTH